MAILSASFISNSVHAQSCSGNFVTNCYELLNQTACNIDFTNYAGNYYQCNWVSTYCAPVYACSLNSNIYTYSCIGTYSEETLVSQNGTISSVQIYCPFGCSQQNALNYHAGGSIPQADLCNAQPRVVSYWCIGNRSYENITGVINSMQCQFGCDNSTQLNYHAGSPNIPQADLCLPSPFDITLEEIAIGFSFIFGIIFLLWVVRKVGRI